MTREDTTASQHHSADSNASSTDCPPTSTDNCNYPVYHVLKKPILMIGYGSIGRGTLPLLERHFSFRKQQLHVLDPDNTRFGELRAKGYHNLHHVGLTPENYVEELTNIFGAPTRGEGPGDGADGSFRGIVVNVSVDTSTVDIMQVCRLLKLLYIDTVVEPWKGFYDDPAMPLAARSNYALREEVMALKKKEAKRNNEGGGGESLTSITCCGANPGMVSFMVKEALMILAKDLGMEPELEPQSREEWAKLMRDLGVKGVHIAERDTQVAKLPKPAGVFCNTWSSEGFVSEGQHQPAELGWGTHEKWMPPIGSRHEHGCKASIYLAKPGAATRVRTWCPTLGPQHGFLVTHNESISIADFFTVGEGDMPEYRPTVHYAYQPCPDAIMSMLEAFGNDGTPQPKMKVYTEDEIATGFDELGVLLYGHKKNALWFGSTLTHEAATRLAPEQNATGLQVTSALIAGLAWGLENPKQGIVEADELDYKRCLEIQRPYLGKVWAAYTDWTPLRGILPKPGEPCLFPPPERTDTSDAWQFANVLVE